MSDRCARVVAALTMLLAGAAVSVQAAGAVDASDYLLLPTVTFGEREVEARLGTSSSGERAAAAGDLAIGVARGVTQHWFSELAVHYHRGEGSGTALRGIEWENVVQLAELGEWPVDVGMALDIAQSIHFNEGASAKIGPLLQKEFGKYQVNLNVLFGRYFRGPASHPLEVEYQSQIKYRYREPLEFGVQAFGTPSSINHTWAALPNQEHRFGPVILGRIKLSKERSISYNAAYLRGFTVHSVDSTLRVQIEYEF